MRAEGPNPGLGLAGLRVVVGVTFVAHGAPKLFRGGVADLAATLSGLGVPLPELTAWGVSLLEFGGGLALVLGLLVTPVALALAVHLAAGIVLVHAPAGWHVVGPLAEHPPGGVELSVVLLGALFALVLAGSGSAALDARRGPETGGGAPAADADGDPGSREGAPPNGRNDGEDDRRRSVTPTDGNGDAGAGGPAG